MDRYTRYARIYPSIVVVFPIIVIGMSYSIELGSFYQVLSGLGVSTVLAYFMSSLVRERGKKVEPSLWVLWGGPPTSQLLSINNEYFDKITKAKYHSKMSDLVRVELPSSVQSTYLDLFAAWTKFLITKTRDQKKFPLVFRENVEYGFRRNLWAAKPFGILFVSTSLVGNYLYHFLTSGFLEFSNYPVNFFISELVLTALLLIWSLAISRSWVKTQAYSYAERLIETIDQVHEEESRK